MKIEVRAAKEKDLPQIRDLIDRYIAVDFYTYEDLEAMLRGEDDLLLAAVDTDRDDKVAAFFYAFLAPLDRALEVLHVKERPEALAGYDGNARVGVCKTTVTDPAYRKRGIFTAFMTDIQPVLRDRGAGLLMNTALRPYGRDVPIAGILRDTGFVPVSTLYRPWVGKRGYCPYCMKDYCICDAVLYIREFDR